MKILIALIICLLVCWFGDQFVEPTLYKPHANWQSTSARVTSTRPITMHANPGAIVTYQFSVGGKAYEKCMYQKYPISDLTMSPAVKALKDKLVIAYYDPADPNQSISPDIGRIYAEGNSFWLGLECMGVFFAVLMWLLFKDMARFGGGDASSLRTSR